MDDGIQWEHVWAMVMIPVAEAQYERPYAQEHVVLAARCRNCDSYFTKSLRWNADYRPAEGKVGLPRFGCVNPELRGL